VGGTKHPPPDLHLFREAVADAVPLKRDNRVRHEAPRPRPTPRQRLADERAALAESLAAGIAVEDRLDIGDEPHYLRPGLDRQILRDLRRGRWVTEAELDLHGATRDEARQWLAEFIHDCRLHGHRVVRIVHGRGLRSPGKVGILRTLVRGWLMQKEQVLAYCQTKPQDGGEGALLALLARRVTARPGEPGPT
jgi:DNA-nicking Smr family endonuclease